MASNCTEELLKFYNKQQLIKLLLEVQQQSNETISRLPNEMKLLKENCKKLESDILVSKTVSSLLTEQMNHVKRQCWRECLEVVAIPSLVNIKDLEGNVCRDFNRIGIIVKLDDIEACHRLFHDKKRLPNFQNIKICQQVSRVKEELKNIDPIEYDFPGHTTIFINESLCFYYKMLWNKCKKLIYTYFTSNGNI